MPHNKVIFVAFSMEDESQRNFLKGQSLHTNSPFEYVDMSVKEAYAEDWKTKVRTRIRRSNGVIALISRSSLTSSGQKWEIACAQEERKPVFALWAYSNDRTVIPSLTVSPWSWDGIGKFIDRV